jgi:hypothetical protein
MTGPSQKFLVELQGEEKGSQGPNTTGRSSYRVLAVFWPRAARALAGPSVPSLS